MKVLVASVITCVLGVRRQEPEINAEDHVGMKDIHVTMDGLLSTAESAYNAASSAEKKVSEIENEIVSSATTSLEFKDKAAKLLEQVKRDAMEATNAAGTATVLVQSAQDKRNAAVKVAVEQIVQEAKNVMNTQAKEIFGSTSSEWDQLHEQAKQAGIEAQNYYKGLYTETQQAVQDFENHALTLNNEAGGYAASAEKERRSALWAHWLNLDYLYKMREADAEVYDERSHDARERAQAIHAQAEHLQASLSQITQSSETARKYEEFLANPLPMPNLEKAKETLPKGLSLEADPQKQ
eukprot:gene989-341_t